MIFMDKEFLQYFPSHMIQTFDDREYTERKDSRLTRLGNPSNFTRAEMEELNKRGAGIFFTPNQFDGTRRKESCKGINAWFMEMDAMTKEDQMQMIQMSPLPPSFIVETKKSLHTYWLSEDGTPKNFEQIQRRLIYNFQSDPACKDCSRVMRVPGFMHNKQTPGFLVKVKLAEPNRKYTEQQMMDAFKAEPKQEKQVMDTIKRLSNDIWERMAHLDNKMMLQRLSGHGIVNNEHFTFRPRPTGGEYIDVNDQPADAWVDEDGMIGSNCKGGPTWIQWVAYYGRSKEDILKWFKEKCADMASTQLTQDIIESNELTAGELSIDKYFSSRKIFTWGVKTLDEEATILQQEQYNVLAGETGCGKTAFAYQMALKNAEKYRVLFLSLEMSNESLVFRYALHKMKITPYEWKRGEVDRREVERIIKEIPKNLIFHRFAGDVNIDLIKQVIENGNYDLVFIDNLGYIDSKEREQNDKMMNISRELKWLANETKSCIIAIHHFRKQAGKNSVVIRSMNSLMGSAKVSHDVNLVIQILRNMDENATAEEKAEVSIAVQKDRDFGLGGVYKVCYKNGEYKPIYKYVENIKNSGD